MDDSISYSDSASIKDMLYIIRIFSRKPLFFFIHILNIIQTLIPVYTNVLFGDLASALSGTSDPLLNIKKTILILACFVFPNIIINVIMGFLKSNCSSSFVHEIRSNIYQQIVAQSISFFDQTSVGALMGNISADVALSSESIFTKLFEFIAGITQMVGAVILALTISWKVTLCSLAVLPVVALIAIIGECCASNIWLKKNNENYLIQAEEVITQFRLVKSFDCELHESSMFSKSLESSQSIFGKLSIVRGFQAGLLVFLGTASIPFLTYLGARFILINNQIGVGNLVSLMGLLSMMASGVPKLLSMADEIHKGNIACSRLSSLLKLNPFQTDDNKDETYVKHQGKIEFRNVSFKYPSRDDFVLKDVSFTIEPNQFTAFVGESGCGKTTILALLQRFYKPTSGMILIDGVNLDSYSNQELRSIIASVHQIPSVFSMSIEDNIRYSSPEADGIAIERVSTAACVSSFINELSDGFSTIVSPASLSGGQKQRICIARALLADTPVLLLDEATSALDSESERLVHSSLQNIDGSKTVLIAAHRLATVIDANYIYVISDSKIVEHGTHSALMALNGEYKRLFENQNRK